MWLVVRGGGGFRLLARRRAARFGLGWAGWGLRLGVGGWGLGTGGQGLWLEGGASEDINATHSRVLPCSPSRGKVARGLGVRDWVAGLRVWDLR